MHIRFISLILALSIIVFGFTELKRKSTLAIPKNQSDKILEYRAQLSPDFDHEESLELNNSSSTFSPTILKVEELLLSTQEKLIKKEVIKDRVGIVEKLINQIEDLHNQLGRLSEEKEEIYLGLIEDSLKWIIQHKAIKITDCPSIQSSLINQFDPRAGTLPRDPAILKTWKILNLLCR